MINTKFIRKAVKISFLPQILTERFAVKIYFDNGECKKYVLALDSFEKSLTYKGYSFTDEIWAKGE